MPEIAGSGFHTPPLNSAKSSHVDLKKLGAQAEDVHGDSSDEFEVLGKSRIITRPSSADIDKIEVTPQEKNNAKFYLRDVADLDAHGKARAIHDNGVHAEAKLTGLALALGQLQHLIDKSIAELNATKTESENELAKHVGKPDLEREKIKAQFRVKKREKKASVSKYTHRLHQLQNDDPLAKVADTALSGIQYYGPTVVNFLQKSLEAVANRGLPKD